MYLKFRGLALLLLLLTRVIALIIRNLYISSFFKRSSNRGPTIRFAHSDSIFKCALHLIAPYKIDQIRRF